MKPDWKDAPEWADWLWQRSDGSWWFSENVPNQDLGGPSEPKNGRYMRVTEPFKRTSVERRP